MGEEVAKRRKCPECGTVSRFDQFTGEVVGCDCEAAEPPKVDWNLPQLQQYGPRGAWLEREVERLKVAAREVPPGESMAVDLIRDVQAQAAVIKLYEDALQYYAHNQIHPHLGGLAREALKAAKEVTDAD